MLADDGFLCEIGLPLMMTNNSRKGTCPPRNVKSNQAMAEDAHVNYRLHSHPVAHYVKQACSRFTKVDAECALTGSKSEQLYSHFKGTGHYGLQMLQQNLGPFSYGWCGQRALEGYLA